MFLKALKSKIHRARVTRTDIDYAGSLSVDSDLLEKAGISPYEAVLVANVTNGNRLETYAIPAPAGSGEIGVLGAAARLFKVDDVVIIINFAFYEKDETDKLKPTVLVMDENNKIKETL
jgi:aspartate 1-decarboxylase